MVCFSVIGTQRKVPRSIQTENVKQVCSEFEKETSETLFIQKNRSVFWPGNFLGDCFSQYRVDCAFNRGLFVASIILFVTDVVN